ncbi:HNH endonuclease signature motif containing protein [Kineosporia babensis]|uniref:DUF222 domain-containing protein n=1 Tax=Kineosporia babensis TaxID=499548 RepID=A0A9X1NC16_9ACTN|nr:HNH endonuclease signature motif containing protein [Kineosporia babensis]MCD5312202.1 DUF222 domain-containing protein [Kineosporia babensis]
MPPARRYTKRRNHTGDAAADPAVAADTATQISSLRLTSARIAPETNRHPRTTTTLLEHARGLVDDLPAIMCLFSQARLDQTRAITVTRMLHEAAERIDDFEPGTDRWLLTEAVIAAQAPGLTNHELQRLIERLLLELQPGSGTPAHEEARRSRHVQFEALADGMALITAMVPADIAQLLHGFVDAVADAERDRALENGTADLRTHDQRCADVFAALVTVAANGLRIPLATETPDTEDARDPRETGDFGNTDDADNTGDSQPSLPRQVAQAWQQFLARNGRRSTKTQLNVTITDATLLGLDNTPGLLEGHGPVAAGLARRLAVKPAQVNLIVAPGACTHPAAHSPEAPSTAWSDPGSSLTPEPAKSGAQSEGRRPGESGAQNKGRPPRQSSVQDQGRPPREPGVQSGGRPPRESGVQGERRPPRESGMQNEGHPPRQSSVQNQGRPPRGSGVHSESRRPGEPGSPQERCPAGLDHTLPGMNRYRPGRALTALLSALYPTCTFPGCTTPAARCDLDHLTPFDQGGVTCACNLRPSCRSHHRLKTFGRWSARAARPDEPYPLGSTIWSTPDGLQHHTPPPCLPGMPGWSLPALTSQPSEPAPSPLSRVDLMPAAERTARRTRTWQNDLNWWKDYKERLRRQAEQRARENPPPLPRPRHAPWGESKERLPGLGEPPY